MDVITGEFRDLASCSAMSLSRSGWLAFIAGRRAYGLIDLDRPQEILKKVFRKSKYDVSEVQFSSERDTLIAVASNDKIELIDWKQGAELVCEGTLKGHTRAVTDLSWHRQQTSLLASGSIDNFIYIWDIKDPRSPAFTLPAVTGASQVCWERTSGKYLASAHEGEIKLWDIRKASTPALYMNAHFSKIYSLDFSPHRADQMVSSSADNSVKVWNVASPRQPENIIKVPRAPVWKVRYTPFGDGLVTLVLNTLVRRENNLMLWNTHNLMSPVHTFYGHTDMVLEFGWRNIDPSRNRNDYQLVTWSKDTTMKLWPIGGNLKTMCGEDEANLHDQDLSNQGEKSFEGDSVDADGDEIGSLETIPRPLSTNSSEGEDSGFSNSRRDLVNSSTSQEIDSKSGAPTPEMDGPIPAAVLDDDEMVSGTSVEDPSTFAAPDGVNSNQSTRNQPASLKQEFKLINFGERLVLEVLDLTERYCVVQAETTKHTIYLNVKFPTRYPFREAPIFSFMTGTTLDQNRGYHLLRKLRLTAQKQVNKNRRCLEMCLRQFEEDIETMHQGEQEELASADFVAPAVGMGGFQDSNVPFPRSSGARFCGTGQLVCFGWSYTVKFASVANPVLSSRAMKTPRALSAVSSGQMGGTTPPQFVPIKQRGSRVRFSRTKSRISSTGSSTSEDPKVGYNGRTLSESDPHRISETEESRGTVTIYDVLPLWPFSTELAQRYVVLGDDVERICRYNANVALAFGFKEIGRAWALAATSCAVDNNIRSGQIPAHCANDPHPWCSHPMGRPLLLSLVEHFSKCDIQTTAMLCCIFSNPGCRNDQLKSSQTPKPLTVSQSFSVISLAATISRKKNSKSECSMGDDSDVETAMSLIKNIPESQSLEELPILSRSEVKISPSVEKPDEILCQKIDCRRYALDNTQSAMYDAYIKAYAELLSRLGMLIKSTEVSKCLSPMARENDPEKNNLGAVLVEQECPECGKRMQSSNGSCRKCRKQAICSICNLPMQGLTSVCLHCGHGGHSSHLRKWFETHNECPTGCGCLCPTMIN